MRELASTPGTAEALKEREKELDALYRLASLFTAPHIEIHTLLSETAEILAQAMQHPEAVSVEAALNEDRAPTDLSVLQASPPCRVLACRKLSAGDGLRTLCISAEYPENLQFTFDPREKNLIVSTADILANALELRRLTDDLRKRTEELDAKHTALREVLSQIQAEKDQAAASFRMKLHTSAVPLLSRLLQSGILEEEQREIIMHLISLLDTVAGDESTLDPAMVKVLTPRELEICALIRCGLSTKAVSDMLGIASSTVERHRISIRRKLSLSRSGMNLATFLRTSSPQNPNKNA